MKYPAELEIRVLQPNEWKLVEKTYVETFGNAMPTNPAQSIFFGAFLKDELIGFSHLELQMHLNAVYVDKNHRKGRIFDALFQRMDETVPSDMPVIILPDKRVSKVLASYGYRKLPDTEVYRKDY